MQQTAGDRSTATTQSKFFSSRPSPDVIDFINKCVEAISKPVETIPLRFFGASEKAQGLDSSQSPLSANSSSAPGLKKS